MKHIVCALSLLLALLVVADCKRLPVGGGDRLIVMAPDYLQGILEKAADQFFDENRIKVIVSFVPYDSLIIRAKATPALDLVIGTDPSGCTDLAQDTLLDSSGYSCPFRLAMILAGRSEGPVTDKIEGLKEPEFKRIVILEPKTTFEGFTASDIIVHNKLWPKLQSKIIIAKSIEHLRSFFKSGEADAAVAFESSLSGVAGKVILQRLDDELRWSLVQCGAVMASSKNKASAHAFLDLFDSPLCGIYKTGGVYRNTERK
jgi:molybdate transport system substrate-binding protein